MSLAIANLDCTPPSSRSMSRLSLLLFAAARAAFLRRSAISPDNESINANYYAKAIFPSLPANLARGIRVLLHLSEAWPNVQMESRPPSSRWEAGAKTGTCVTGQSRTS